MRRWLGLLLMVAGCHCGPADPDTLFVLENGKKPRPVVLRDWRQKRLRPLDEKLETPPDAVVQYLKEENVRVGYSAVPAAETSDRAFQQDFRLAIRDLPACVRQLVNERLVAIYLVTGLGSTGFTQVFSDAQGNVVAAFVALDVGAVHRTANEWATWKENSPFEGSEENHLAVTLEPPEQNTRANTLQYLVLHEFGHVVSVFSHTLPKWDTESADREARYTYAAISWKADQNALVPRMKERFPNREKIRFYASPKKMQPISLAWKVYDELEHTPFPSLYSSQDIDEDFADSFANYVHVQLLHRPWQITLTDGHELQRVVPSCWTEERCAAKRAFFDQLLRSD
jgi:hypothetical protein